MVHTTLQSTTGFFGLNPAEFNKLLKGKQCQSKMFYHNSTFDDYVTKNTYNSNMKAENFCITATHSNGSMDANNTQAIPLINSGYIIISLCGGLPLHGWAVYSLHLHRCNRRLSTFVIFLLLIDALQLPLSPALVVVALRKDLCLGDVFRCDLVWYLWLGLSICGLNLHQLVALEGILSRRDLQCCAPWVSLPSSLLICLTELALFMCVVALKMIHSSTLDYFIGLVEFMWCLAAFVLSLVMCVFFCQSSYPLNHTHSRDKTAERVMLAIAATTSFVLYGLSIPALGNVYLNSIDDNIYMILHSISISLSSFRLIADPLLCVLACRKPPEKKAGEQRLIDLRLV
ncbi:uncharacterized protein LOC121689455 isoform X1 [Alosa sapidissima]|uniref:uncharacterized protein LOC121689455 isoform X1 n=2 Tax=Alosa sapidissima TaxID=34773 RepID=UPI001C08E363|nr:uncharacterized protein LOC121689455 isoform X1 [Alosa sapidissima]XP_041925240.1 uncharacterized protein LOC121689455 isoform X1 [Alosa sapidissima]